MRIVLSLLLFESLGLWGLHSLSGEEFRSLSHPQAGVIFPLAALVFASALALSFSARRKR